jgi:DNA polymerase-4
MARTIFLVDMNAFYISCEMTRNQSLKGKPAAVAGSPQSRTGIILAANYEAREFGVKTPMVLKDALDLCPQLNLVPPDHKFYSQKSKEVMDLLSSYSPVIEQSSIDEAWLDMTGTEKIFGSPKETAKKIMEQIKDELNLWCSIGISQNKFLSKMAAEQKKPLGITEIWQNDIKEKLWPLPINHMYGIGKKTTEKLSRLNIQTIGGLANYDKNIIYDLFGKAGYIAYNRANGIDNSPLVKRNSDDAKSIGRAETLPNDIETITEGKSVLLKLSDQVAMTARKHNKMGKTVQITIKYSNFQTITRQVSLPATNTSKEIYNSACFLLETNWDTKLTIRLLGVSLSSFDHQASGQISIFEMLNKTSFKSEKHKDLDKAIDAIRNKHGLEKIARGSQLKHFSKEE